ncbi:MAG: Lytic transglycosylase catalytic [Candidatus Magnetoglobus multicellularis str. Araruama]|uniref:Lytic transglycosylase catalytic n=1 Tax=Candidatus Magnetoglobus multicellularis str. Araruama TaxID=890399 RepID=A0A1V1PF78_9BACT|nr:MAG: Lytic transglycosylase catalytic [Candidatus Magnetoglobus multicellularis str. Araruama]
MPETETTSVYIPENVKESEHNQLSYTDNNDAPVFDEAPSWSDDNYPMEMNIQKPFPEPQSKKALHQPTFSEYPKISQEQKALDEALEFCETSQEYWQKGELDHALDALDQAYQLILGIDTDQPALFQQKEDLRFMISKRILEIYASRNIVVNGTHEAIPIVLNDYVKREIKRFTGVERSFFQASYRRSGKYRKMIVKELRKAGLPEALSWLPLIESGFKVKALSRSRALGLWQFIPSTGYKFGLKRTRYIDERMDPYKSTLAAISYLKELHQIFGDWTTVLAAYNCGEGRVLRTIQRQNINYLDNFWDLYDRLPRETARYVPRFLATLYIINHFEQCGFDRKDLDPPPRVNLVEINRQVHLKHVAARLNIPAKMLYELNPELRYQIIPREPYRLRIPEGKKQQLLATIKKIPVSSGVSRRSRGKYHRVRRGESLSTIARRYGVKVRDIKYANRLRSNRIVAGKTLKIPGGGASKTKYRAKKISRSHHLVQRGDTLSSIAQQYGVNISDLRSVNGIRGNRIVAGTQLKIPGQVHHSRKSNKARYQIVTHRVQKGDSLWNLARKFGTTTRNIVRINNLSSTQLKIGQKLKIPANTRKQSRGHHKYRVKKGDSPFQIAMKHNMSLADFLRLNRLNPGSKIYPGQLVFVE